MTTAIPLTNTQRQVLEHAAEQPDGRLGWFPDHIHGGARKKVIEGLWKKALITDVGPDWFIAPEGYDALGRVPVALPTTHTPTPRWTPRPRGGSRPGGHRGAMGGGEGRGGSAAGRLRPQTPQPREQ
ncbi:MAG: hypothetical protein AW12_02968 [Candidatus Accumulibacter sp. BA-94]|nr:MAG: hypothetical protein AW12_02968 [Candidatus Accumulibacter sp. BA-94]